MLKDPKGSWCYNSKNTNFGLKSLKIVEASNSKTTNFGSKSLKNQWSIKGGVEINRARHDVIETANIRKFYIGGI